MSDLVERHEAARAGALAASGRDRWRIQLPSQWPVAGAAGTMARGALGLELGRAALQVWQRFG